MEYHLAPYGEEFLVEAIGLDAAGYEVIKASLTLELQGKLLGWRNLFMLPYGRGEKFTLHPTQ